jgi:hypothetical protein
MLVFCLKRFGKGTKMLKNHNLAGWQIGWGTKFFVCQVYHLSNFCSYWFHSSFVWKYI